MSEYDKAHYYKVKADPAKYAAYLEQKRAQRSRRQVDRGFETARKRAWRKANPEKAGAIRTANHKVEQAIKRGVLVRPASCSRCRTEGSVEAHHHLGYAPEHWLDVVWLCEACHGAEDARLRVAAGVVAARRREPRASMLSEKRAASSPESERS